MGGKCGFRLVAFSGGLVVFSQGRFPCLPADRGEKDGMSLDFQTTPDPAAWLDEVLAAFNCQTGTLHKADGSTESFQCTHTLSEEHIAWFRAGGALNVIRANLLA